MAAFKLSPSPEADRLVMGLRAIAVLGLAVIPVNYSILKRLLAIVQTVLGADPFVTANAARLQAIAWMLLALQLLGLVIGAVAKRSFHSEVPRQSRCRLLGQRLARCPPHVPAGPVFAEGACAKTSKGRCAMAIAFKLDDVLHDRMTLTELADRIGVRLANPSILKTGKARFIRFSTLEAICKALSCQPGDLLRFQPEPPEGARPAEASKMNSSGTVQPS